MSMKWYPFDKSKGYNQKRPPIRKYVLVLLPPKPSHVLDLGVDLKPGIPDLVASYPPSVAVGYRKDAAGDKTCPYFVVPGLGGEPLAWCDCLPDDFEWPKAAEETNNAQK